MNKKKPAVILIILFIITLGGCWSRNEIETLAIVGVTGLDKVSTGNNEMWQMNNKIIKPAAGGGGGGQQQGQGGQETERLVTGTGDTIKRAQENVFARNPRILYMAHNNPYIIGEDVARKDVKNFVDYIMRAPESRLISWLLIAEGKSFKIINSEPKVEKLLSEEIKSVITNSLNKINRAPQVNVKDFVTCLATGGRDPVLPKISLSSSVEGQQGGAEAVKISGMAVFKKDRLAGWMNEIETKGYLYVTGEAGEGNISINSLEGEKADISISMKEFSSQISPVIQEDEISFEVQIEGKGALEEYRASAPISQQERVDVVEKELRRKIKEKAELAIRAARDEYKADIFGFGETLHKKSPSVWKENKQNWYDIYSAMDVNVIVDAQVVDTGMLKETPQFK